MKLHFVHWWFWWWTHIRKLDLIWYEFSHYLMSYHYIKDDEKKNKLWGLIAQYLNKANSIILDSGAFSAFSQGSNIDIDEYSNFIKKYISVFDWWFYAWLDVIWDAEISWKNQKYMEWLWLKPLPTYHYWEPLEYLHRYLNEYDYIGIWWLVPLASKPKKIDEILWYVFHYILKHKLKTKIHWRWMTNPKFMMKYPFYSVDSSWRVAWWKFNRFLVWDNSKNKIYSFTAEEYRKKYWLDPAQLEYIYKLKIVIDTYQQLEKYTDTLHEVRWMKYWK